MDQWNDCHQNCNCVLNLYQVTQREPGLNLDKRGCCTLSLALTFCKLSPMTLPILSSADKCLQIESWCGGHPSTLDYATSFETLVTWLWRADVLTHLYSRASHILSMILTAGSLCINLHISELWRLRWIAEHILAQLPPYLILPIEKKRWFWHRCLCAWCIVGQYSETPDGCLWFSTVV